MTVSRLVNFRILLGAVLLMSAGLISIARAAELPKVKFTSQDLLRPSDSTAAGVAQRRVVKAFLEEFPQYEIEPFSMPSLQGSSMESGPLMAIAAGFPPHAIYVNFRMSSTFMEQGFLDPVEILLARILSTDERVRSADQDGRWLANPTSAEVEHAIDLIKRRVPVPAWPVIYREDESGVFKGKHIWSVPTANLVMALMYRKDLFCAAGLDPDRGPKDWAELLDYSRKLTVPTRGQYGMSLAGGSSIAWSAYSFLLSSGARVVNQDSAGQWRAVYDSPESARAVSYLRELVTGEFTVQGKRQKGSVLIASKDITDVMWQRGQIAMQMAYLSDELLGDNNPQLVGIAPTPASPQGNRASELNCKMLGVFSKSTPAQKIAVMRYIWFITGESGQRVRTQAMVEYGLGPFVNPSFLARYGYDDILRQVPKGWQEAYQSSVSNGVPEPYGHNTQGIWRVLSVPINRALELPFNGDLEEEQLAKIKSLLAESAAEVNIKVLGIIPSAEMQKRRVVAIVVILGLALTFVLGFRNVWAHFGRTARQSLEKRSWRKYWLGYLFLAPAVVLIAWWEYAPLTGGLGMAFVDYRLTRASTLVGVDNFASVLFDDAFWSSLWKTFYFLALMVGLGFWPPILLAILLQEVPTDTLKYFFRTVYYLPAVVSGVIVMFLWRQLYDPSDRGVLNQLLMSVNGLGPATATVLKMALLGLWLSFIAGLAYVPWKATEMSRLIRFALFTVAGGLFVATFILLFSGERSLSVIVGSFHLQPVRWIESPELAMLCVVIPTIWASAGPGCIIYLAALKTVPDELYEAADLDGANHAHKIVYIVLPQLRYLIIIQLIAAVIGAMKGGADYILALTGGGPNGATNILALEIFTRTFFDLKFGIGTAMSWILGALLIGVTAYQLKMLSKTEFKSQR